MYVPPEIMNTIDRLSQKIGCTLTVVQCWNNEFHAGMYCRFRGILHESQAIKLEVAGTLCVEFADECNNSVDLFFSSMGNGSAFTKNRTSISLATLMVNLGGTTLTQDLNNSSCLTKTLVGLFMNQ